MRLYSYKIFRLLEKVKESPIENISSYNKGLEKSVVDKLFFMEKIDTDLIVDFGCADGKILKNINKTDSSIQLVGYDVSTDMLNLAKSNVPSAKFTNNWNDVINIAKNYKNSVLLLSSVIHEVYSYSDTKEIKKFWEEKVFGGCFKYIVIRDMIPSASISKEEFLEDVKKVNKLSDKKYLNSFENIWGLIDNDYRTFLHWLLKFSYIDNWEREVKENYLPITLETLYKKIPRNYKMIYKNNFIFEPIQKRIIKAFGIVIKNTTHTKLIIERI